MVDQEEENSDDSSSEKSTELITEVGPPNVIAPVTKELDNQNDSSKDIDVYHSVTNFLDDDFDTKLKLDTEENNYNKMDKKEIDNDVPLGFSDDIWNKPSNLNSQNLTLNKQDPFQSSSASTNISQKHGPPGLSNASGTSENETSDNAVKKKRTKERMRSFYKKAAVRSDEQAFNFHMRQQVFTDGVASSYIEEENKSTSNLNLSTSSRSYKPSAGKANSAVGSHDSFNISQPMQQNPFVPNFQGPVRQQNSQEYFYKNVNTPNMPLPHMMNNFPSKVVPDQLPKPFPQQYNYGMGNMHPHPAYPIATSLQYNPHPIALKQAHSTQGFSSGPSFAGEKIGDTLREPPKGRNTFTAPTIHAVTSDSSSNITSGSTSPTPSELRMGTGQLKFFNQQHQYGFIISDKDGSDIFFHYDDVKHTLLSKEFMRHATENYDVRFSFQILDYVGKYESSKKAVNLNLLSIVAKTTEAS